MSVKLLTEHNLEFISLKGAAQACLSLHFLKCHIVGNNMRQLIFFFYMTFMMRNSTGPIDMGESLQDYSWIQDFEADFP